MSESIPPTDLIAESDKQATAPIQVKKETKAKKVMKEGDTEMKNEEGKTVKSRKRKADKSLTSTIREDASMQEVSVPPTKKKKMMTVKASTPTTSPPTFTAPTPTNSTPSQRVQVKLSTAAEKRVAKKELDDRIKEHLRKLINIQRLVPQAQQQRTQQPQRINELPQVKQYEKKASLPAVSSLPPPPQVQQATQPIVEQIDTSAANPDNIVMNAGEEEGAVHS